MNMLQNSPHAQALAFNNISLDFFNNFWAWLTVIFWRIRIPKPELLPPYSSDDITEADKPDNTIPEVLEPCHDDDDDDDDNGVSEDVVGITKGKMKFTSYFYEDVVNISDDETLKKITWEDKEGRLGWWERWEKLLITRMGENENGWYTCQDITVLNGNVVRFWDDDDADAWRKQLTASAIYVP